MADHPTLQNLMNTAYNEWQKPNNNWTYRQFLNESTPAQRKAILLGNFNYQVHNGGFMQWVDNGYGLHAQELLDVLEQINTDLSKEVISLVKQIMPYIDFSQENRGWGDYWLKEEELHQRYIGCWEDEDEDLYEEEDCQGSRVAQTLDSPYYKIADAFLEEAEAFLSARKVGA